MTAPAFPAQPYRGLSQYRAEDSLLFTGRAYHVDSCAEIIARVQTRILLLHGHTGCGKSSFLRAGLIPALETRGFGYLFLRRYANADDQQGRPVFIRCGSDPLGRLAEEVYRYITRPIRIQTAVGERLIELSGATLGAATIESFVQQCAEPEHFVRVFMTISRNHPFTLVLVLDQVEEVLTLNPPESANRERFFEFLKLFNVSESASKLILALRKDHSGEFIGLAQLDNSVQADFKVYLLPELKPPEVLESILLPTSQQDIEGLGSPFQRYRFSFAPGVAENIVDDLFDAIPAGAILPVMQIICQDLVERVRQQGQPPWVIDARLYDKGSLSSCVQRHISKSLRASFGTLALSDGKLREEERRWRKVLYSLVRHEGDGRVHTDVLSRSGFLELAHKEGTLANPVAVFDHLTLPEVLVLRRLVIPTVGRSAFDEPMCSLGHDVVGLALWEMLIRDTAQERSERERRRRLRWAAASSAVVLVLFVSFGGVALQRQRALQARAVQDLLRSAAAAHDSDAGLALVTAAQAALAEGSFNLASERQGRHALTRVLAALPDGMGELPAAADQDGLAAGRNSLLVMPPGFMAAGTQAGFTVRRVRPDGSIRQTAIEGVLAGDLKFDTGTFVSTAEPYENITLIMFSSPGQANEDLRSRLVLLRDQQTFGPFSAGELLDKFTMLSTKRDKMVPERPAHTALVASLSGNVIVLTTQIGKQQVVRTLLVNEARNSPDLFAPGTQFATTGPAPMQLMPEEPQLIEFPAGAQWLSAEIKATGAAECAPTTSLMAIRASSLRNPVAGGSWELPSIADCPVGAGICSVDFFNNPIRNGLIVLRKYKQNQGSQNQKYVTPMPSSYLVIDSETAEHREVDAEELQKARRGCSVFASDEADAGPPGHMLTATNEPAVPAFVDGALDDLVFGFTQPSSVQAVRLKAKGSPICSERLHLSREITQWRFVPASNLLMGLSDRDFMAWNLAKNLDADELRVKSAAELVQQACRHGLERYMRSRSGKPATTQGSDSWADLCAFEEK